jgi:hypothetical protein
MNKKISIIVNFLFSFIIIFCFIYNLIFLLDFYSSHDAPRHYCDKNSGFQKLIDYNLCVLRNHITDITEVKIELKYGDLSSALLLLLSFSITFPIIPMGLVLFLFYRYKNLSLQKCLLFFNFVFFVWYFFVFFVAPYILEYFDPVILVTGFADLTNSYYG